MSSFMKVHSYFVYIMKQPEKEEKSGRNFIRFLICNIEVGLAEFIYFLFAPTLCFYRNYERTERIRWRKVFSYVMQIILGAVFSYIVGMFFSIEFHRKSNATFGSSF